MTTTKKRQGSTPPVAAVKLPEVLDPSESERAVLGLCLIDTQAYVDAAHQLKLGDFYLHKHALIWDAIGEVYRAAGAVDLVATGEHLRQTKSDMGINWMAELVELANVFVNSLAMDFHLRLIRASSNRRRLLKAADAIKAMALDSKLDTDSLLSQAAGMVTGLIVPDETATVFAKDAATQSLSAFLDDMEAIEAGNDPRGIGLPSTIPMLTRMVSGYQRGHLGVIGANTGEGKSALMVQDAVHIAQRGHRVLYVNLEMTATDQFARIIAQQTGVSMRQLRQSKRPDPALVQRVGKAHHALRELPLVFHDASFMTVRELEAVLAANVARFGIDIAFVDYLTLMRPDQREKGDNTAEVIAQLARDLKALAKKLNIPIVTAAQMNRVTAQNSSAKPSLHWIQGSAGVAQNADWVALIYRPDYRADPSERADIEEAQLIVAKNRHDAVGTIPCLWLNDYAKFAEQAPKPY
jgi:replicative DNA helicase